MSVGRGGVGSLPGSVLGRGDSYPGGRRAAARPGLHRAEKISNSSAERGRDNATYPLLSLGSGTGVTDSGLDRLDSSADLCSAVVEETFPLFCLSSALLDRRPRGRTSVAYSKQVPQTYAPWDRITVCSRSSSSRRSLVEPAVYPSGAGRPLWGESAPQ